jgi:5-bromo-4-chloroindolyl phosphate hydrolysis protein
MTEKPYDSKELMKEFEEQQAFKEKFMVADSVPPPRPKSSKDFDEKKTYYSNKYEAYRAGKYKGSKASHKTKLRAANLAMPGPSGLIPPPPPILQDRPINVKALKAMPYMSAGAAFLVFSMAVWVMPDLGGIAFGFIGGIFIYFVTYSIYLDSRKNYEAQLKRQGQTALPDFSKFAGLGREEELEFVRISKEKIAQIRANTSKGINCKNIAEKITSICDAAGRILDLVNKEPKRLTEVKNFLDQSLDQTTTIVREFATLQGQTTDKEKFAVTAKNFEDLLNLLDTKFKEVYEKFLDNNYLNLEVDIETLKRTIQS